MVLNYGSCVLSCNDLRRYLYITVTAVSAHGNTPRCDRAVVMGSKEVGLIQQRLIYFLQGKWCVPVTGQTGDEGRAAADGEMKDWFAAAEQVCVYLCVCLCVFVCVVFGSTPLVFAPKMCPLPLPWCFLPPLFLHLAILVYSLFLPIV